MERSYKILKFRLDVTIGAQVVRRGLTLQEARLYCSNQRNRTEAYFHAYTHE